MQSLSLSKPNMQISVNISYKHALLPEMITLKGKSLILQKDCWYLNSKQIHTFPQRSFRSSAPPKNSRTRTAEATSLTNYDSPSVALIQIISEANPPPGTVLGGDGKGENPEESRMDAGRARERRMEPWSCVPNLYNLYSITHYSIKPIRFFSYNASSLASGKVLRPLLQQ